MRDKSIRLIPPFFDDSPEFQALTEAYDVIDENIISPDLQKAWINQFIVTADELGIRMAEDVFGINGDPTTEPLEFRRQRLLNRYAMRPPLTVRFLRNRLDSIIGKGQYTLIVDSENFLIIIETASVDQLWYDELYITINNVKPANMLFVNKPLLSSTVLVSERISMTRKTYNYRAGISVVDNETPIASMSGDETVKDGSVMSIKQEFIQTIGEHIRDRIAVVVINDSYSPATFDRKDTTGGMTVVEYTIPVTSGVGVITNIKYKDGGGNALTENNVYIPVTDDVIVKHNILTKEGV